MNQDRGLHISDCYKLLSKDNRSWLYTLVYKKVVYPGILLRRNRRVVHWFLDRHCLVHRAKVSKDFPFQHLSSLQYGYLREFAFWVLKTWCIDACRDGSKTPNLWHEYEYWQRHAKVSFEINLLTSCKIKIYTHLTNFQYFRNNLT